MMCALLGLHMGVLGAGCGGSAGAVGFWGGVTLLPLLPGETLPVCRALAPKGGVQCCPAVLWAKIFCFSFPLFGSRPSAAACALELSPGSSLTSRCCSQGTLGCYQKFFYFFIAIYMQEGCQSVNESILQCSVTNEVTIEDN